MFLLVFFKRCDKSLKKTKEISCEKADSLKHISLNVRVTKEARKSTVVSKSHANKDLYSIQELCHNIGTLL